MDHILPYDALVKIFTYLSAEDLVYRVQHVCRFWRLASWDPSVWNTVEYCPGEDKKEREIANFLRQAPMLRSFQPQRETEPEFIINTLLVYCTDIRKLKCDTWPRITVPQLKIVLNKYFKLVSLHIKFVGNLTKKILYEIGKCQYLKQLIIEGDTFNVSDALQPIADGCPLLERFGIYGNLVFSNDDLAFFVRKKKEKLISIEFICGKDVAPVLQALGECKKLEHIRFVELDISKPNIPLQPLKKLKNLKSLSFTFCRSSGQNFFDIASNEYLPQLEKLEMLFGGTPYNTKNLEIIFSEFPHLENLTLYGDHPYDPHLSNKLEGFGKLSRLEELNFSYCVSLTDEGVWYISKCRRLKHLNISWCPLLTDIAVQHLTCCSELQSLVLNGCEIIGDKFYLFPKCLKCLTELSLKSCRKLERSVLVQLKEEMPQLKIIQYF